jgi:hypothetical protein
MKLPCLSYTHWAHQKGKTGYEAALLSYTHWAHQKVKTGNEAALFIIHTHNELIKKKRQEIKLPCMLFTQWADHKGKTGK